MKRLLLLVTVLCALLTVSTQDFFKSSKSAHAKGKPGAKWDARFASDGGYGAEVENPIAGESDTTYRTIFGTGNVVVTVTDDEGTERTLDDKPFLIRASDKLSFRIGIKDGHSNKDRYEAELDFPQTIGDPGTGEPWLEEVVEGSVDPVTLDMATPDAHVILHLHQEVPLIGLYKPNKGKYIGNIRIGDIEFSPQK